MEGVIIFIQAFIQLAIIILLLAGLWKTFAKAGQPGWASLVPIYNLYVLVKISGRPGWWFVLFIVPLVNVVVAIIVNIDIAKHFGKGAGFGVGLAFLSFVFFPILGFSDAKYSA